MNFSNSPADWCRVLDELWDLWGKHQIWHTGRDTLGNYF